MALCIDIDQNNFLTGSLTSVSECTSYVLVDSIEYQLMLQTYEITPLEIAESFSWGFATYISFWFLGYVIRTARNVIKVA